MAVIVDKEACIACGICVGECPEEALSLEATVVVNADACIACGICVGECPEDALSL